MYARLNREPIGRRRTSRGLKATVGCEALEDRQLLSRGMGFGPGLMGLGGGYGVSRAEFGSFGGGAPSAVFGSGGLGLGGGARNPIFLLTASILDTSGTTKPSRSVLSSSAVQTAFQTLQTDLKDDITVGSKPTHASVGQLQDDLASIRNGKLTGSDATTAIQNDETAILTSMGLTSSQISQIQSDLQAVQSAIQSASGPSSTSTTLSNGSASTTSTGSASTTSTGSASTASTGSTSPTASPVQSAFKTLQTDLSNDTPVNAQPTNASIGQLEDDLNSIGQGKLTGSQAATTVQADAAAVFTSEGMSQSQVQQIQADQTALATAIPAQRSPSSGSAGATSTTSNASPTSIAAVEATMQSVQPYLVGVPGVGPSGMGGFGDRNGFGEGGPTLLARGGNGSGGGPMAMGTGAAGGGAGGATAIATVTAGSNAVGPILVGSGAPMLGPGGRMAGGFGGWN